MKGTDNRHIRYSIATLFTIQCAPSSPMLRGRTSQYNMNADARSIRHELSDIRLFRIDRMNISNSKGGCEL
jgi:hypothetical protein